MSQISLTRNSPSGIRLPSISTLAQQSNIRLPEIKSPSSPKNLKIDLLPALDNSSIHNNDATTAASLVQLSQNGRTLPQPIISSPSNVTNDMKLRSKSDMATYSKQYIPQQQPNQVRSQSYNHHPPSTNTAAYSYNTPPPPAPSRVFYSPSQPLPPQFLLHHQQQVAPPPPPPAQQQQQQQTSPQQHPQHHPSIYYTQDNRASDGLITKVSPPLKNQLSCQRCGTTETPEWRRGPNGARTLCNACGLYHAKLVKRKGALAAAEEMKFKKVKPSRPSRPRAIVTLPFNSVNPSPHSQENVVLSKYHIEMLHHQLQSRQQQLPEYAPQYHIAYQYDHHHPAHQLPPPPPPPQQQQQPHHYSPRIPNYPQQQQQQQQQQLPPPPPPPPAHYQLSHPLHHHPQPQQQPQQQQPLGFQRISDGGFSSRGV